MFKHATGTAGRPALRHAFVAAALIATMSMAGCRAGGASADPAAVADVVVYKTPYCGCCSDWVAQLERDGLTVTAIDVDSTAPVRDELGVPARLGSCHTAKVGDYWVEGHVPIDLVRQLVEERPAGIRGLAVPGMPIGSPGMEGPNPERYAVLALDDDGSVRVYAERDGAAQPPD